MQPVLSRIENEVAEADSALLLKAAQAYNVPVEFFDIRDPVYGPPVSVHPMLRARADVTSKELDVITAELNIRLIHLARFLDNVDYNTVNNIPVLDIERYGSADKVASTVRAHWGIPNGPIRNLTSYVEKAGVIVGLSSFNGASVSGVSFRVAGRPPIILLNKNHPADRMRFTLAHELGHLVMHRFPTDNMEDEANKFASALLMPEAEIRAAFLGRKVTLELLAALKPEWRVAMQALLVRATALNIVTSNQARYLWQQISSRNWRTKEPAELDFIREEPKVYVSILGAHVGYLGYSYDELSHMLRMHLSEFSEMYGAGWQSPSPEKPKLRLVI